ncbi:MAG: hypothetical protein H7839_08530 [Magnetococcus sp. YQC-5]
MNDHTLQPSRALYTAIRKGFISQGTTFNAWCQANGVMRQNATSALIGAWDGPKGRELRRRLFDAAKIQPNEN